MTDHFSDQELASYLRSSYAGVFDEKSISFHIENHVGFGFAEGVLPWVVKNMPPGGKLLDVGAGFGAFVIAARREGLDAVGVELIAYEVDYARNRLARETPQLDANKVFYLGDAHKLPFDGEIFDSVTLWNVLEHVPNAANLLSTVVKVLKPGGCLFIACPNYASFRSEAHYQVFWPPLLPRSIASQYLKLMRKNPSFFEQNIYYRTNWEVLSTLRKLNLRIQLPALTMPATSTKISPELQAKLAQPELVKDGSKRAILKLVKALRLTGLFETFFGVSARLRLVPLYCRRALMVADIYNPLKKSILLCAQKPLAK